MVHTNGKGSTGSLGIWGDGDPPLAPPPPGRGIWGDGDPPLAPPPPGRGIWGDGEMSSVEEIKKYVSYHYYAGISIILVAVNPEPSPE
ncbi:MULTISPECIES: hypothetical protein [unclassified Okeania]|uniref:hypothetical protein n=1 Tax=unclassified Okeania TaxID=2634635 RepID=UPI0013B8BC54|nr:MULTISPECIES: hypothetical protein [unclassified Okeania]NET20222.1 hypothetical protein [Okeania sp. SIO1H5]NET95344.1 hypothetical protein [Okeania sp. SIO1H2]